MLLGKDDILKRTDFPSEDIDVPEWGGTVRVQGMSGKDRDAFEAQVVIFRGGRDAGRDLRNFRARLVAKCVVDEDGNRLFTDADIEALGELSAMALERVFEVALRLNGMSEEDVKELTEDFGGGPSGSSTSPSP